MKDSQPMTCMGINKDHMNATFIRKYRWTVESNLGIPTYFLKSFNVDWTVKEIELAAYETCGDGDDDVPILKWVDAIQKSPDKFRFKTFDGCGNTIYDVIFEGVTLLEQRSDFEYSCSDVSAQRVKLKYEDSVRYFRKHADQHWQLVIDNQITNVSLKELPSVEVEETSCSLVSGTTFIPGKVGTKTLEMYFEDAPQVITKPTTVKLQFLRRGAVTQSFTLEDFLFTEYDGERSMAKARFAKANLDCHV